MRSADVEPTLKASEPHYLADLSHELRGPLTVLDLRLQTLAAFIPLNDDAAHLFAEIRADVHGLFDVVSDVLLIDSDDRRETDEWSNVCAVSSDVAEVLGLTEGSSGISLKVVGNGDLRARIAPTSLRRCLMALVDNAVKHSPAGGRVTISVEALRGEILIAVTDSGKGVDPSVLSRLWDRNVYSASTLSARPSFGIGLALVRETVVRNGGTVSVLASGPSGTSIGVRLSQVS